MIISDAYSSLTDEEEVLFGRMAGELHQFQARNTRQWKYYDGEIGVKNMGIAIPPSLHNIEADLGWPEIVVDSLAERLEWLGWRTPDESGDGLDRVFDQNQLQVEVSKAILDSLVTGVGFLAVSRGDVAAGEPEVLVDAVSSSAATYVWDERRNRMAMGYVLRSDHAGNPLETLYLPDETISTRIVDGDKDVSRSKHGLGKCTLIALPNRARTEATRGRSEISRPIRYLTDNGIRTLLEMEYNREFYTTPQRYLLNVAPEQLGMSEEPSKEELVQLGWQVALNKALVVPPAEDGYADTKSSSPVAGQFSSAPPTPYIEQLRALAQLVSAQSGVPATYLGFVTDNPASADAIRAMESRLVKKAELRQLSFGKILANDLAFVCQSILEAQPASAEFMAGVSCQWREASTPTVAATMDAMVKATQVNMVPKNSRVVWDKVGFSKTEQEIMAAEMRRQESADRMSLLARGSLGVDQLAESLADAPDTGVEGSTTT